MMISKFNKLIRNKAVWAVIAILISLAMVGLFTPSGSGGRQPNENAGTPGTLFGEPISRNEFNRARLFAQSFQPQRNTDSEMQERIQESTWQRLALVKQARKLGLTVTDHELREAIRQDPSFAVNGTFNRRRYRELIETRMRVRIPTFEVYLREEILLRKMMDLAGQSLWVSAYELNRYVEQLTDRLTLQIASLPYSNTVADVEAEAEAVRAFYDDNADTFEVPEMRSAKYVNWPISNHMASVEVSEASIQNYYDTHLEEFAVTDTNANTTYTPLEEASDSIRDALVWRRAMEHASEAAMQFTDDLSLMDYEADISIESVAAKHQITVHTTAFFAAEGDVPGLNVGETFRAAAYRLKPTPPEDSYSHTIIGDEAVYVLAAPTIQEPYIPSFEAVQQDAKAYANERAKANAFESKLNTIRETLVEADNFTAAAKEAGLTVKTLDPFSIYDAATEDMEDFSAVAPVIMSLENGAVSPPIRTSTGGKIAFMADRQAGDLALGESIKSDVAQSMQSARMRLHFETWARDILANARTKNPTEDTEL